MNVREPILETVSIKTLRPTQMTIGLREVAEKRMRWRTLKDKRRAEFLGRHMIPVIRGPKDYPYLIDHHHLARALQDEGQKDVLVVVVADLRALKREAFWVFLDHQRWCHPYNSSGERRPFDEIPHTVSDLKDDPFRSLAG